MSKQANNSRQETQNRPTSRGGEHATGDIAGSPSSQSNSSFSQRQNRIVELLHTVDTYHNQEDQLTDWVIRQEFFEQDVADNSEDDVDEHYNDQEGMGDDGINIGVIGAGEDNVDQVGVDDDDDDDDEYIEDDYDIVDEDDYPDLYPDYVIAPDDDFDTSSDDDDAETEEDDDGENEAALRERINYDTSLPVSHPYLGENLEELHGRQVFEENSTCSMPLFNLSHIVLFPGQVLPISTSNLNYRMKSYLETCINKGWITIGLMCDPHTNRIGTTAEIRNYSTVDGGLQLTLIIEGRQRFELISEPFEIAIKGLIRILPEVTLGKPYPHISTLSRFLTHNETPNKFIISKHPPWVLKKYEATNLMRGILNHIKDWSSVDMTKKPSDFSYWVSSNLPISNTERMKALSFSCTEARLLWLLNMLENSEVFVCSACKNVICYKKDVFPMSRSGPQCSFVNTHGYIHDTLTVMSARGLIQEQRWSHEFSWFPGYAWRMAHCDNCNRHIGWCYKSLEPNTKPKRFFGLSRSNVRLNTTSSRNAATAATTAAVTLNGDSINVLSVEEVGARREAGWGHERDAVDEMIW